MLFHFYELIKEKRKKEELVSLLVAIMIMFQPHIQLWSPAYTDWVPLVSHATLLQIPNLQMKRK